MIKHLTLLIVAKNARTSYLPGAKDASLGLLALGLRLNGQYVYFIVLKGYTFYFINR